MIRANCRDSGQPKQQGTGTHVNAKNTSISDGIRVFGPQFEDDLYQFKLQGFAEL